MKNHCRSKLTEVPLLHLFARGLCICATSNILMAGDVLASPFLVEKDKTSASLSASYTQATNLALPGGENPPWWKDDLRINTLALTLSAQHGLADNINGDISLSFSNIKNEGTTPDGPLPREEEFSNLSSAEFGMNYRFLASGPMLSSIRLSAFFPGSQTNTSSLVSPNSGSPAYKAEIHSAFLHSGLLATGDLGLATRPAYAPNQFNYKLGVGYVMDVGAAQAFIGGKESDGGGDLPTFGGKAGGTDYAGRPILPFYVLRENYKFWGVSVSGFFDVHSVGLTYVSKLEDGAVNTDINSTVSLTYSVELDHSSTGG